MCFAFRKVWNEAIAKLSKRKRRRKREKFTTFTTLNSGDFFVNLTLKINLPYVT